MRELESITIVRGAIHVIAPRDPKRLLQLSEAELPLASDEVSEILAAHVDRGLRDSQAKAASFVDRRSDRACGAFRRLITDPNSLLVESQALARMLYAVAEGDERVSDGTLAVLLCDAKDGSNKHRLFPAILKLDPSATLHTVADTDAAGKPLLRFEVDNTSLPSKNERIQKCCFVHWRSIPANAPDEPKLELLVVDRQRKGQTVSQFWITSFLGADFVFDAAERTRTLYRSLKSARNNVEAELTASEVAALDQVIAGAVVQAKVNIDELIQGLPVPAPIRDRIDATLSASLPDREFDLDPDVASNFVRRRTFKADNGIRLSINPDAAETVLHVEDIESGDDDSRLRKVWFETRTWQEA